jgi:hypothetical protein
MRNFFIRITTTVLLLTTLTKVYCQGAFWTGLVKIEFENRTVIDFYKVPTDKVHYKSIEFFFDVETDEWTIDSLVTEMKWLKPEVFWLGNSQFAFFRCKSQMTDWFELIVNNENGTTLWIKQCRLAKFVTWEEYLKSMFVVSRIINEKQKIRKLPSDTSDEIEYDGGDCFRVKKLKDDWIEIFTPDNCDIKYIKTKIESGWIKWRKGDKPLVDYYKSN